MSERVHIPAEWGRHACCWMAYPHLAEEWGGALEDARREIAGLAQAIAGVGGEPVRLLVHDGNTEQHARTLISDHKNISFVRAPYGDCWTRDTLPLFGVRGAVTFRFNAWGRRFDLPDDEVLAEAVAAMVDRTATHCDLTLEGGALELNGEGHCILTESCVLNPNRNPGLTRHQAEQRLSQAAVIDRFTWLAEGLEHDHTDGHVDLVARFVSPNEVVCMMSGGSDPMHARLEQIRQQLSGAGLSVHVIPSPGTISYKGHALAGSYCNFYIANDAVVVPLYNVPQDTHAVAAIAPFFPGRETIGLPSIALLSQGGAFHCVTQPIPEAAAS